MRPLNGPSVSQSVFSVHRVLCAAGIAALACGAVPLAVFASPTTLTVMVPQRSFSAAWESAFQKQCEAFQSQHPGLELQILKRGKEFSSLPEFVAAGYMGEGPHAFLIESAETEALTHTGQAVSHAPWLGARLTLFADQEILFRHHLDPQRLPAQWSDLVVQSTKLSEKGTSRPLGIPILSARGPWILEALMAPTRAWQRNTGGIRFSPKILEWIERLRSHAQVQLGWDEAVQQFLNRKLPFVLGSSEWAPFLKEKAEFRFASVSWTGPHLGFRWASRKGLDAKSQALVDAWMRHMYAAATITALSNGTGLNPLQNRGTLTLASDPAILNVHHEWSKSLREFFSTHRTESDAAILAALEVRLASTLPH